MTDRGLLYSEHVLNKGLILLEALLKAHFFKQNKTHHLKDSSAELLVLLAFFDVQKENPFNPCNPWSIKIISVLSVFSVLSV